MHPLAITVLLTVALLSRSAAGAPGDKLVVVVAKGSAVKNLSRADLKRAFSGDVVIAGGKKLVPFNLPTTSAVRLGFDQAVLGMSGDAVGKFWVDRKVRGQSDAPRAVPSPAHVAKVCAKFPGAIGYLPADQLTSDVQPVTIDGVAHTAAHYAITSK